MLGDNKYLCREQALTLTCLLTGSHSSADCWGHKATLAGGGMLRKVPIVIMEEQQVVSYHT